MKGIRGKKMVLRVIHTRMWADLAEPLSPVEDLEEMSTRIYIVAYFISDHSHFK